MKYAFCTNTGRRLRNEDSLYVPTPRDITQLVAVADGMGGHAAGIRASTLAVEGVSELLCLKHLGNNGEAELRQAVQRVNLSIYRHAQAEDGCRGMGTTLTAAILQPENYIVANVGDSRLYHFDGETIAQVTVDHSLVAVLVQSGAITMQEAAQHPQRNIITRALGTGAYEEVDLFLRSWAQGDILLLCSDGLHGSVSDFEMESALKQDVSLEERCNRLVQLALNAGATDNVTVVLAQQDQEVGRP